MSDSGYRGQQLKKIWSRLFEATEGIRDLHSRQTRQTPSPQTTFGQLRVMHSILFSPDGTAQVKDLARELAITPGAVSQAVDKLVKDGMVQRTGSAVDRRSVSISLSREGLEIHRRTEAAFSELTGQLLQGVPEAKQRIFLEVLEALIQAVAEKKKEENTES